MANIYQLHVQPEISLVNIRHFTVAVKHQAITWTNDNLLSVTPKKMDDPHEIQNICEGFLWNVFFPDT